MKNTILSAILSLFIISLYAQRPSISFGPTVEIPTTQNVIKTETGYLGFEVKTRNENSKFSNINFFFSKILYDVIFTGYDASMNKTKTNTLTGSSIKFVAFEPLVQEINNKPYLMFYEPAENNEDILLKIAEIDFKTLSILTPKTLFKIELDNKEPSNKLYDIRQLRSLFIESSPDKSKTLFLFKKGTDNTFTYGITDNNMNITWSKTNPINSSEDIITSSACVDNAGTVYIGYKAESRKNGFKGHLLIYNNVSKKEKDILISDEFQIYQILLLPSKNKNIINVAGTSFKNYIYLDAVFSATINTTDFTLHDLKKTNFEDDFIDLFDQGAMDHHNKKNKHGLLRSKFSIYELEDESIGIMGELRNSNTTIGSDKSLATTFIYGSILNVNFRKDKTVFSRVPKIRETYQTLGDGVFALPYKNDILIFYNDDEDNLKKSLTEMPSRSNFLNQLVLVMATITNEGKIKRDVLIDLKKDDFLGFPAGINYISPTSFQVPFRKIKKGTFAMEDFIWGNVQVK